MFHAAGDCAIEEALRQSLCWEFGPLQADTDQSTTNSKCIDAVEAAELEHTEDVDQLLCAIQKSYNAQDAETSDLKSQCSPMEWLGPSFNFRADAPVFEPGAVRYTGYGCS